MFKQVRTSFRRKRKTLYVHQDCWNNGRYIALIALRQRLSSLDKRKAVLALDRVKNLNRQGKTRREIRDQANDFRYTGILSVSETNQNRDM